ncbi:SusC/RagA family protein [Alistipes sp. An116]|uniref:SusC/RagA family TonB-linked outer membrane protein n=1 Tax=Alistipes sp. An116 TaxID=1965546 RepID=UPI000B3B03D4|nr:SusC/RagA family protein [Alistipes sp. An116]
MEKTGFAQKNGRLFRLALLVCLSCALFTAKAQTARITLNLQNATLEQAMDKIKAQTRYLFINRDVEDLESRKVSINVSNELITKVLDQLFTPFDIGYDIDGRSIFIYKQQAAATRPVPVSGRVTDASGQPIIGASVIVRGTTLGVSTDAEGRFMLEVPAPAASQTLEVSYLGYETATIPVGSRTSFAVTLRESASEIESVVVTALGIKREEKALSYNVQQVGAEEITTVKDANFMNSLAGKVAGVTINASSSGVGGATKVVLRGNKSISQSSNALYVIDGIPMYNFGGGGGTEFDSKGATESIADLNPEDIESISVLTGAAAAALYGSNAANGAVMITTKKGQAGALKVTLSSNTEFLNPFVLPEFQNRYGTGLNGSSAGSAVYSWGQRLTPAAQTGYTPNDFFETGHVYTNAFTLSGGTDRNQTYFSAAAVNSDGIIPNNTYDRYNFTFRNTSYFLKDKLRLDASASYIYQQDQNMTNQGVYSNPLVPAYLFPRGTDFDAYRIFERYNPASKLMEQFWSSDLEGGDLRMQNPYWIAYRNLRNTDKKRYLLSFSASYDILPWLNVAGRVRIDNANSLYTQKLYASSNTTITDGGKNGHYTEQREYDTQTYADVMVNINKTFGDDWSLQANVGASINNVKTDLLSYRGPIQENGLSNVFNVFDLDDSKKRAEKSGWQEQTQSLFASVEVGWKQMLYLTVTGRNDWASQLAESPESSFFYPSVGLSWVPTSLWDMGRALTYLKIRGSIASVGMPFPRHLTIPTYEYDATNKVWTAKTHYPIGDLYPERTRTYELGLDARLWRHVNLSASWYWADTYNQTFDPQISVSSGYSTIYLQTGHVRNTGVELSAGYDNTWRDFRWATNFTFSWNKNEIVELVHNYKHPETGEIISKDRLEIKGLGKAKYILKPGGTLGDLYTNSDLVYNREGFIEVDKSGNVAVKDDYMEDIYLGSVFPKYNLAWRNDFSWKGLNLGVLFTARIGGICYSATQANMDLYGVSEASAVARDAGGVLINGRQTIDAQKWYQAIGAQSGLPQYYTYSATNFRLQELSLGYTLPAKWFREKMRMTISFVGRNLWMIYCKAPFDPEAVASTGLNYQGIDYFMMPSLRSLGFNVKFQF